MSNYITVEFPEADTAPKYVYKAVLHQAPYKHEMLVLQFKDWNAIYDTIKPGSPIRAVIKTPDASKDFFGYVHHIQPDTSPGKRFVELACIGATFPLKQASQKVWLDHTADMVARAISIKHGLNFIGIPHPRIFEQIGQAGLTEWQFLVKLAKQIGYTLRGENTEIYFEPILTDYTRYRQAAKLFAMRETGDPEGSTLYSFRPVIGESLEWDGDMKAAVAVSGVDRRSKAAVSKTKQKRNTKTRAKAQEEFFDRFNTLAVTPNDEVAKYESDAAEARNSFPYRGNAVVLGDASLRPNMPIYLDGVGDTYSGYWTILATEHVIIEKQRNNYEYTTMVTVGSDSVGLSMPWTDGKNVAAPTQRQKRVVIPGVKQTKQKPKTSLVKNSGKKNLATKGSFGKISNRAKTTKKSANPSNWKSANPTPAYTFAQKTIKSPSVAARVRAKAAR